MRTRLRTTWLASSGAMLLVLLMAGVVAGASVLTTASGPAPESETDPLVVDTTATWEDLDGDGVDDDCDTGEVLADPTAAAEADAAVDLDGDGTISVSEAARSDRTGGANCNHGGYVSGVANAACEPAEAPDATETPDATPTDELDEVDEVDGDATCDDEESAEEETAEHAACDAGTDGDTEGDEALVFDPAVHGTLGAFVSQVAQSAVVGGKHCNHGGAVSEAVKAAKEAAREAREAAKAERAAQRAADKAERAAERAAAKAERDAAKAERKAKHGKGTD